MKDSPHAGRERDSHPHKSLLSYPTVKNRNTAAYECQI